MSDTTLEQWEQILMDSRRGMISGSDVYVLKRINIDPHYRERYALFLEVGKELFSERLT